MRVSIIINAKAGSVNEDLIRRKVGQALFRCELAYCVPASLEAMRSFICDEVDRATDAIVVCGGDGTINAVLQVLMPLAETGINLPGLCVVMSGTANDLAFELGVDRKIQSAVRVLLEGTPRKIDVIEIEVEGQKKFMITCGGLGVPARTAQLANQVRFRLRQLAAEQGRPGLTRWLAGASYNAFKSMGASIYSMMLFYAFNEWEARDWEIEVIPSGRDPIITNSGFIFVNNQPSLGANFFPAPYTANDDGLVNVLMAPVQGWWGLIDTMIKIQKGTLQWGDPKGSLETSAVTIRNTHQQRNLCFFGDGEILFSEASHVNIKCLHRALLIYTNE